MSTPNLYEKSSLKERFRELAVLALFTAAIAGLCLIVMDIIILPLSIFAIKNSDTFTYIIQKATLLTIILTLLFFLIRRVIQLKKDGLSTGATIKYLLKRPFHYLGLFLIFIIISAIIILLLYMLLSYNDLLIHNITGS